MKVLIDINHPAHVHFFKHLYWDLIETGHDVLVVASKKDINFELLNNYSIPFINIGTYGLGFVSKLIKLIFLDIKMLLIVLRFKPDYVVGINTIRGAHAGFFTKKTQVYVFTDTEHAKEQIMLYKNIADKIFTPDCFTDDLGKRQVRYPGYHELAYLHPNRFTPDKNVLKEYGVSEKEKFYILRFVSWDATHDVGQKGLTNNAKKKLIDMLEKHGKVFITSEAIVPEEFKKYQISVSPEKIHHLMFFSQMYIGEGGTMASEAAMLGVPSLYINSLGMGSIKELEEKYRLLRHTEDSAEVIKIVSEWLKTNQLDSEWAGRRRAMLKDKTDVSEFVRKNITEDA